MCRNRSRAGRWCASDSRCCLSVCRSGYLSGSGWADYQATGAVCGVRLPAGLQESQKPEPIFTPATKAEIGEHDENIDFDHVVGLIGRETATRVRDLSLQIYRRARFTARARSDPGRHEVRVRVRPDGAIVLADEVLT